MINIYKCGNFWHLNKSWLFIFRRCHDKVQFKDLNFRNAAVSDKGIILNLRHNVYRGLDYLADYLDFFLQDCNRRCVVAELQGQVVAFGVMLLLDGGTSVLSQAGRVHEHYEGRGIFSALNQYVNSNARQMGCKRRVALVETSFNKYARSEKFRKTHSIIASKLHYAGVVTRKIRERLTFPVSSTHTRIRHVSEQELSDFICPEDTNGYLFPHDRILLDFVPYRSQKTNLSLLHGKGTEFFSTVSVKDTGIRGLLSASSRYKCTNPPQSYTIDIFGDDHSDLEAHVHFHLARALTQTDREFCLQIFVERGYIAEELCKILTKLDIPKCNWFVEGGVTTKTIAEEVFSEADDEGKKCLSV